MTEGCPALEGLNVVWALFKTDELGKPQEKIAGSVQVLPRLTVERKSCNEPLDEFSGSAGHGDTNRFDLQTHPMVRNWGAADFLRRQWQKYIAQAQNNEEHDWTNAKDPCSRVTDMQACNVGTHNDKFSAIDVQEAGVHSENMGDAGDKDHEVVLPIYRLHVENPEDGDDYPDLMFAAALILNRYLLEQKLNCSGQDLYDVPFLNLNHEGLSSLGEGVLSNWCPKTRVFTADMNRLNHLDCAFMGYEETLEQLSLKDNFLCDLRGLEFLHRLQVMHLDGNSIFEVIASSCHTFGRNQKIGIVEASEGPGSMKGKDHCMVSTKGVKYLPMYCWPDLKELGLSCNRISRVGRLGYLCPKLEVLDLGSNYLTSLGAEQECGLLGLRYLRVLDVGQNRLKGRSLWEALVNCPLLISLVASRNRLQELPTHGGSVFLRELWLNGNAIKCFACTAWMPNLQRLYLQDNEIDTITPIWGFPALEVLDLSFNRISKVHELKQLGCFSNLRSLQLNDNPVSEPPDYVGQVLEAVPWLVELDNEALTEPSRHQAIKNIFLKVMVGAGLNYILFNILRGKVPFLTTVDALKQQTVVTQCTGLNCSNKQRTCDIGKGDCVFLERHRFPVNKIMEGDAEIAVLWATILEISQMCNVTYHGSNALNEPDLSCQVETQWRMHSFQLMCLHHKQIIANGAASSKQVGKGDSSLNSLKLFEEDDKPMSYSKGTRNVRISDAELCLLDHVRYDDSQYKEYFQINEEYHMEICSHMTTIVKLQALLRGFLTRNQLRCWKLVELQEQKGKLCYLITRLQAYWKGWKVRKSAPLQSLYLEKERRLKAVIKVQALWRGFETRKRFQRALQTSKYEDADDFDYVVFDDAEFPFEVKHEDFSLGNRPWCEDEFVSNELQFFPTNWGLDNKKAHNVEKNDEDHTMDWEKFLNEEGQRDNHLHTKTSLKELRNKAESPNVYSHSNTQESLLEGEKPLYEKGFHKRKDCLAVVESFGKHQKASRRSEDCYTRFASTVQGFHCKMWQEHWHHSSQAQLVGK